MLQIAEDNVGKRVLLMGNQAIARGAIEAGVQLVTGYPGTPASEIIETLSMSAIDAHIEWAANEKVAFDVAVGGAIVGARSMCCMKNAGLNWIVDMLMTIVYGGVRGGLSIVVADDPGAHYSSNEQDTRFMAYYARIPCLEPSNQQEAKDLTKLSFEISEKLELPVMVRSVTRLSHSSGDVTYGVIRKERNRVVFDKHWKIPYRWNVYGPPGPVSKHRWLIERMKPVEEIIMSIGEPYNKLSLEGDGKLGVVASGIAHGYAVEALSSLGLKVDYLKISIPYPAPRSLLTEIMRRNEKVVFIEEGEPVVENQARIIAQSERIDCEILGKGVNKVLPEYGELTHENVRVALASASGIKYETTRPPAGKLEGMVAPRSSTLCAGCPHLGMYWALKLALAKKGGKVPIINGDIGCYEQGGYGIAAKEVKPSFSNESVKYRVESPYEMLDTNYIMGGGFGLAQGQYQAGYRDGVIVGLAGDSTFFHACLPAVVTAALNKANVLFLVLDNRWTAMTGHQPSPTTGIDARGVETIKLDIERVAKSLGIKYVSKADPWNLKEIQKAIEEAVEREGPKMVISERVCTLQAIRQKKLKPKALKVYEEKCTGCKLCVQLGCPAVTFNTKTKKAGIDPILCVGCYMCAQICPVNAIGD